MCRNTAIKCRRVLRGNKYSFRIRWCFRHGCDVCNANRNSDGSFNKIHPIKNIPFAEIRKMMQEKKQAHSPERFRMVSIKECEWLKIKKQEIASVLKMIKCVQRKADFHSKKFWKV